MNRKKFISLKCLIFKAKEIGLKIVFKKIKRTWYRNLQKGEKLLQCKI